MRTKACFSKPWGLRRMRFQALECLDHCAVGAVEVGTRRGTSWI